MKSLERLIEGHLASHDSTPIGSACTKSLSDLDRAGRELSMIARRHLRFGALAELTREKTDAFFIRSFRGRVRASHASITEGG